MAKKGQTVQLQVEVNTDEEWEKLLSREGLIIVDVFSEWCGPCLAMQAMLKKLKLEVGGDLLHLAMAKSDTVTCLKRFLDKCEPTWMFMAQRQMVHILFGANAPVLQQAILDELKKEKDCIAGARSRSGRAPNELSEEERGRFDEVENKRLTAERIKKEKIEKQIRDRKMAQAKNILDTMAHNGIIIIFPHCANKMSEFTENYIPNSGLVVSKKERPILTAEALDDIEYFSPYKIPELSRNNLTSGEKSYALMVTLGEDSHGPLDDKVLSFIYGPSKRPPGDKESPADFYMKRKIVEKRLIVDETESVKSSQTADPTEETPSVVLESEPEPEPDEEEEIYGIWAPANELVKASALRYVFPLITAPLIIPEPEPIPPHVAVAFDAFKRDEVLKLSQEFTNDVMACGFFTSQVPEEAKLIAKSKKAFLRKPHDTQFGEKIVVKLSRKKSDAILAFAQLGPTYISGNVDEGERECAVFFPDGYADIVDDVVEEEEVPQKKKDKKKDKKQTDTAKVSEDTIDIIVFEEGVIGEGGETIAILQETDRATATGEMTGPAPDAAETSESEVPAEVAPSKTPSAEAASGEASAGEAPAAKASATIAPAKNASRAEAPLAETPSGEAPSAEVPPAEPSKAEATPVEAPAEEPPAEAPPAEAPPAEEPPAEVAPTEQTAADELPPAEAPAATEESSPPTEGL